MRLFFAYWPSAETAQALMDWVRRAHALYGGRMMRSDTLHLTLAFLGQTEPERAQPAIVLHDAFAVQEDAARIIRCQARDPVRVPPARPFLVRMRYSRISSSR